jgi:hypothetical protein
MHWSELLMVMTEDENGRLRASEEKELMRLWIDEFFIKLVVFKQRLEKRKEEARNLGNNT